MTSSMRAPFPRSFLYVPATRPELFKKASEGDADAVILDLEDAVPMPLKRQARQSVRHWLDTRAEDPGPDSRATDVWVRADAAALAEDLDAVVGPALDGVFLAKSSAAALDEVSRRLDELEAERGLAGGTVGLIGLVESAEAMLTLATMVQQPRLTTLGIGETDLLGDLRIQRAPGSSAAIDMLRSQVVLHCAAAGLAAPVAPTSTAFRDLQGFETTTRQLFELGFRSRTAIHPTQVPVIHSVFTPGPEAVAAAQDVVARFEAAGGGVAADDDGHLIDAAVVREARETLSRRRDDQPLPERRT